MNIKVNFTKNTILSIPKTLFFQNMAMVYSIKISMMTFVTQKLYFSNSISNGQLKTIDEINFFLNCDIKNVKIKNSSICDKNKNQLFLLTYIAMLIKQ